MYKIIFDNAPQEIWGTLSDAMNRALHLKTYGAYKTFKVIGPDITISVVNGQWA